MEYTKENFEEWIILIDFKMDYYRYIWEGK